LARTVYYTAASLDGFVADADNSVDWLSDVEHTAGEGDRFGAFFADVGAMAMGATTYAWVLDHLEPPRWREYYGETPCWVFAHRSLPEIEGANVSFVQGDVAPVHEQMARAAGEGTVWLVGGGDLVGQFADRGLLDEIHVGVAPVTLGGGAPLLPRRLTAAQLELAEVVRDGQFARLAYRLRKGASSRP
jgi:dihydrofolate reductase